MTTNNKKTKVAKKGEEKVKNHVGEGAAVAVADTVAPVPAEITAEEAVGMIEAQQVKNNAEPTRTRTPRKKKKPVAEVAEVAAVQEVLKAEKPKDKRRKSSKSFEDQAIVGMPASSGIKFVSKADIGELHAAVKQQALPSFLEIANAVLGEPQPDVDLDAASIAASGIVEEVGDELIYNDIPDSDFQVEQPEIAEPAPEPAAEPASEEVKVADQPKKAQSLKLNRDPIGMIASFLLDDPDVMAAVDESTQAFATSMSIAKQGAIVTGSELFEGLLRLSSSVKVKFPTKPAEPTMPVKPAPYESKKGIHAMLPAEIRAAKKAEDSARGYILAVEKYHLDISAYEGALKEYEAEVAKATQAMEKLEAEILAFSFEFLPVSDAQKTPYFTHWLCKESNVSNINDLFRKFGEGKLDPNQVLSILKDVLQKQSRSTPRQKLFLVKYSSKDIGHKVDWTTAVKRWVHDGLEAAKKFSKAEPLYVGAPSGAKASIVGLTPRQWAQQAIDEKRKTVYRFPSVEAYKKAKTDQGIVEVEIENPKYAYVLRRLLKATVAFLNATSSVSGETFYVDQSMVEEKGSWVKSQDYDKVFYEKNGKIVGTGLPENIQKVVEAWLLSVKEKTLSAKSIAAEWELAVRKVDQELPGTAKKVDGLFAYVVNFLFTITGEGDTRKTFVTEIIGEYKKFTKVNTETVLTARNAETDKQVKQAKQAKPAKSNKKNVAKVVATVDVSVDVPSDGVQSAQTEHFAEMAKNDSDGESLFESTFESTV